MAQPSPPTVESRQPTGWRKWAFRLAAMTLVPIVILGVFEITLRLCGYGYATAFFVQRTDLTGPDTYIANAEFGRRFFPPGMKRSPLPLKLSARKPANTRRIFILGESAALGFPDHSSSFARILEVMLADKCPDQRFEILNTSMVAINSNTILPIARECAGLEPDIFLVFMGNNEVVGPFGAAGVIGPFTPSVPMIRANLAVKSTRTGQLMHQVTQWLNPNRQPPQAWEGMAVFQHCRIRCDDPQVEAIDNHLRQNLRDICRAARGTGAAVIVSTVPVNLKDSPPFASLHAADLTEDATSKWEAGYNEGVRLEKDEECAEAIAQYEKAATIDEAFAELHFRWGRCLLGQGKTSQAREKFMRARDLDALRFRADGRINDVIRAVAEAEEATLVDAEEIFRQASPVGIPGEDFFLEHVHLNFAGNHLLARGFCEKILALPQFKAARDMPILSADECAKRLAHTEWNRLTVATQISALMKLPPFTNQLDHEERNQRWQKKVNQLRAELAADGVKRVTNAYEQAIRERETDWMLAMNYAAFLGEVNELPRAASQFEKVAKREPHIFSARVQLGRTVLRMGKSDEAKAHFNMIIKVAPEFTEAHYGLAEAMAAEGSVEGALEIYAERVKRDPAPAQALERMAGFLARLNKLDEAKARLDEALALNPDSATVHANLGDVLVELRRPAEARPHYETALRLRPGWAEMIERLAKLNPKREAGS